MVFCVIILLIAFSCLRIFSLGFLNDEWLQLGYFYGLGIFAGIFDRYSFIDFLLGNGRILCVLINNIFFYCFRDNPFPFAVFALVFHTLNSYLAYLVTKELTGKKNIAFITALLFAVPATAHQAISWFAATIQTVGGMTFVFVSIYTSLLGIKRKNAILSIASWILAYIAFLFKESSFFVFPLLLILPNIVVLKKTSINWKKYVTIFFIVCTLGYFKLNQFFQIPPGHLFTDESISFIGKSLLNTAFYPLVSLGQFYIPFRFMLRLSTTFGGYYYSFLAGATESNRAASVIVADLLSIIVSFIIILLFFYIYLRKKPLRKVLCFAFCWYILSFIPMAVFLPERNTSYLESRYLYFSFYPVAFITAVIWYELTKGIAGRFRNGMLVWGIMICFLGVFLLKQITVMQREIRQNIVYGQDIRYTMSLVRSAYPGLPDKPIFLVEGDRNFYYAKINLPFQTGVGYMLALIFRDNPVIPKEILAKNFLSKYEDYGYKEEGSKGFGYFGNREELLDFFRKNPHISPEQIISFYYFGYSRQLKDQTQEVRSFIKENR